ncbi:hypothetical protein J6590_103880 [Homalodisca vitripennis]|nr:hypothetical protein J6590_103880 [Homalodisca vitripennis]
MDDNGLVRIGDANQGSRKKPKTASVRTLAKLKRHGAPLGCRVFQPCKHLNKGVKCALVRPNDALNTRQVLYKEAEKNKQDGIIASWKGKAVVEKTTGRHEVSTVKVKSTDHFRFQSDTEQFISLQKKGWSSTKCFSTPLEPVPLGHAIKASKKKDVESLLKLMYGDEWKNNANLSWYKIILEETPECHEIEGDEEECECDCLEPDVGLHI